MENKIKKNPSIRFQQPTFRIKLQQARNYKRSGTPITEPKSFANTLKKNGWAGWAALATLLLFGFSAYLFFFPNYFSVKTVLVSGSENADMGMAVKKYLQEKKIFGQQNTLFVSASSVEKHLLSQNPGISDVVVKKIYPSTLSVQVEEKKTLFEVRGPEGWYELMTDGLLEANTKDLHGGIYLAVGENPADKLHKRLLSETAFLFLREIAAGAEDSFTSGVEHFFLQHPTDGTVYIFLKSGFTVIADTSVSAGATLSKGRQLLQFLDQRQKNSLSYIDLRLLDKAFVCLKNSPCSHYANPVAVPAATGTEDSIIHL